MCEFLLQCPNHNSAHKYGPQRRSENLLQVHRLNTKTELRQIPTHRVQIYRLLVGAFAGGASLLPMHLSRAARARSQIYDGGDAVTARPQVGCMRSE